jgi:Glycoside hydrolase family 44/Bacterial Ig-like domain (group 3)
MQRITIRAACHHLAATLILVSVAGIAAPRADAQTPTLTVDAAGNPHPINPDIYGMASYGLDANFAKEIQIPNIRWGGDGTTRYNWQVDSSNAGFDWFFMGGGAATPVVPSASPDLMVNTFKAASNAHTLLTIPIIPWVNKSAAWNCSFPVSVYGAQQATNPYVHPNGDNCGNSIAANGTQLLDTKVYANHIDNTVALQQGWVQHMITTFGTAANGGVPYYQLDNEPGGWSNTHRDVEPAQPDYDTIISLGQQYAAMIKQTDPSAKVFGPVDFTLGGWIGTPAKQNNLLAGQYYLQQMAAYDAANHQRILDYFDEHYYGGGSTDALELADTRSLWDPTYNSGTWVEQFYFDGPMSLLPRFQGWIQTYYPGTKLSISEYSFAMGTNPLVDMLTETDVLGIYGRQSLDFANMWNVPKPTDPLAYSFRIYRNFDGAGGQFGETSVNSTSTDQGQLSAYGALRSSDGALTVVAINKTTSAIQTSLTLANFNSTSSALVYTYSNANLAQIIAGSAVSVASNSVTYNFPAYSATVFVFTPASATLAATTTSLAVSNSTPTTGQSVKFTATVAPKSGTGTLTGTVTFSDGANQIGSGSVNAGSATFTTSTLANGSHNITAAYSGDTSFAGSASSGVNVAVSAPAKTATTTSASPSATQLASGQTFTLSISVAPASGSGTPTGIAAVLDGQTQLAAPTLVAGAASFSSSTLAAGSHSFTVNYSGDANFAASTSATVAVTVTAAAKIGTTTSISPSATQLTTGQTLTLNISVVRNSGSATPTGTVTILDGQTQLAMPTLVAGAASFSSSTLAAGSHSFTANYSGDSNFAASTSAAVIVTVTTPAKTNTSTSVSASANQIAAGASVTFTARVAPQSGSGTPTGAINFFDAQAMLGSGTLSGGSAQFTTMSLAAGTHGITATYSGDANFNASNSAATTVTVTGAAAADYSISMSSSGVSVAAGAAGTMSLTVTPENGFKQAVSFSCSGLPTGANCSFNPPTVVTTSGVASTTLTIQTPAATAGVKAGATPASQGATPGNGSSSARAVLAAPAVATNIPTSRITALYIFAVAFAGMFGIFGAARKKQRACIGTKFLQVLFASTALAATIVTASCAGYINNQTPPPQTKTYTIVVTATAPNSPTHSQSFVLTVAP